MLTLGRHVGQKIMIGEGDDRIVLTVLRITADDVRIGITAPRETPIWREEVLAREQARREEQENNK